MQAEKRDVLRGIQSLRAVAALAVAAFHASNREGAGLIVGQAGVDLFFVISGFIMWFLRGRGPAPATFITDRIERIVPLYWIATSAMVVGGLAHVFPKLTLSPAHMLASYFFIPYPSPNSDELWPLLVQGWTLNYEMFFYALFALSLTLPHRLQMSALCGALLALATIGWLFHPSDVAGRFYTNSIIVEFGLGACIGALWERGRLLGKWPSLVLTVVGVALLAAQLVWLAPVARFLGWGMPAALIVLGVVGLERSGISPSNPTLLLLGNASYSIYLFHTFAVSVFARVVGPSLGVWPATILGTAAAAALGVAVYLLIEKPLMQFLRARPREPRVATA